MSLNDTLRAENSSGNVFSNSTLNRYGNISEWHRSASTSRYCLFLLSFLCLSLCLFGVAVTYSSGCRTVSQLRSERGNKNASSLFTSEATLPHCSQPIQHHCVFFYIRYNIVNIRVKKANLLLLLFTSEATFSTEQHYSRFTQATRTSAILFLQSKLCELLKTPVQKNKKHLLESTAHLCTPCLLLVLYLQRWPGWPLTFQTTQVQTEAESLFKHYSESCLRRM